MRGSTVLTNVQSQFQGLSHIQQATEESPVYNIYLLPDTARGTKTPKRETLQLIRHSPKVGDAHTENRYSTLRHRLRCPVSGARAASQIHVVQRAQLLMSLPQIKMYNHQRIMERSVTAVGRAVRGGAFCRGRPASCAGRHGASRPACSRRGRQRRAP